MEQFKELRRNKTAIGIVCFSITTAVLMFVDILCVGAYFGIILCLLYLTFLKDCIEIFIYAIYKFMRRLNWLYRIFKLKKLLYISTEANEHESNVLGNFHDCPSVLSSSCLVKNSPSLEASSSYNSKAYGPSVFSSSHSHTLQSESENKSSAIFQSPQSTNTGYEEPAPRKLSSLSTHVISSTENFNIDETNFEDVDLTDELIQRGSVTPKRDCSSEESSIWNIGKMRFLASFRKNKISPTSFKTKVENIAGKMTAALPNPTGDSEKLIRKKNDTPEQIGCCTSFPQFLKNKYQMSSVMSYARF